jgi:hypothetical protein
MSASSRLRLEVEFLEADRAAPAPAVPLGDDERMLRAVLVVAGEADFRAYVRECLRERTDLRVLEAASVTKAVTLAAECSPVLIVVDEPEAGVVAMLPRVWAIIIVDEIPRDAGRGERVRLLVRPFTADSLLAEVHQLLQG